jgi:hypothetical protein
MQALTVAIGPAGIDYFAQRLVAVDLVQTLAQLKPPNNDITVPDFSVVGFGYSSRFSRIKIQLRNGSLVGYTPRYGSISQIAGGKFPMKLSAQNFSVNYDWHENYHEYTCYTGTRFPSCHSRDPQGNYKYSPAIGLLTTDVTLGFVFNPTTRTYDIKSEGATGKSSNVTPNIPAGSVVQNEDQGCFTSKVSDATAQAVSTIDFGGAISQLIPPLLRSIPASGKLTPDIHYEFALGDSGLTFPDDNKGIKIGVTGRVRYRDEEYPGQPPPALPVPPPPLDQNHMNVYVSDYEINALQWAYFRAGLLTTLVTPSQLPDPDVLKVKTYVLAIQALKPYQAFSMNALVEPLKAPVAAFAEVYQFTEDAMKSLHQQLPSDVYQQILGMEGDGYSSWDDVVTALEIAEVPTQYYDTIKNATKGMGMVVTQDLKFTLTIQNGAPQQPNIIFSVARTDILDNLGLGITGNAQTMKFGFRRVKALATFISSTVPGLTREVGQYFGLLIWPVSGEPRYTATLSAMGQTGVPIPIMSGFQFLFQEATLSIQKGFVSILAKVAYKSAVQDASVSTQARR